MTQSSDDIMLSKLERLFRPLAGLCLRRGFKIQQAIEALKRAFVEVAEEELRRQHASSSVSRIAVMSGLHRREVMRLTSESAPAPRAQNLLIRVIGQWQNDTRFSYKRGTPRALSFEGADSEFSQLVQTISKDLNTYTVLFELERIGAIKKEHSQLILTADVYVPDSVANAIDLLAADEADLLHAVEENIFSRPKVPHLHIKTQYDNVIVDALPRIREWLLHHGARFHEEARNFLSQFDKDVNPALKEKPAGARVALAAYSHVESETENEE